MKHCASCGESKEKTEYGSSKGNLDGLHSWCKPCRRVKRQKFNSGDYAKNASLLKNYGINLSMYNAILAAQDGHCALCARTELLGVDHDHVTLKVRGILCRKCNLAIGHFDDSVAKMAAAIIYLGK